MYFFTSFAESSSEFLEIPAAQNTANSSSFNEFMISVISTFIF